MNRVFVYLLMVFGEALILLTSFLFLKEVEPTELFALNTTVISIVYLLIYSLVFDIFNVVKLNSDSSTASWGAYLYGVIAYSLFAIVGVVASYLLQLDLFPALLMQGGALFVLFLLILISSIISSGVKSGMDKNEDRKTSLQTIKHYLDILEINIKTDPNKASRAAQVENIKNQVRFITYSDNPIATDIERELYNTINYMTNIPASSQADRDNWLTSVDRCNTLIELRKQQH